MLLLFVLYHAWRSHISSGLQLARLFWWNANASLFAGLSKPKSFIRAACCGVTQVSAGRGVPCVGLPRQDCLGQAEVVLKTTVLKNVDFTNKHVGGLVPLQVRVWANLENCHVLILSPLLSEACNTRHSAEKGQACLPHWTRDLGWHGKRVGEQLCYSHWALLGCSLPSKVSWILMLNLSMCCHEKLFAALLIQELGWSLWEDPLHLPTQKASFSLPVFSRLWTAMAEVVYHTSPAKGRKASYMYESCQKTALHSLA